MSDNTQPSLSKLDCWLLARVVAAYVFESIPFGVSPRAETLARQLMQINFKDRELLLKRNVTQKEADAILKVDTESEQPAPPVDDSLWTIVPGRDLKYLPPLTWLIPDVIVEGGICVLYGESGTGKSFIALDYAMQIAQEHRVVYVPAEGEAGYRKRVAAWCQHHGKDEAHSYFLFGYANLFEKEVFELLLEDLMRLKPKLAVFDTLAMVMTGGDENGSRDMGIVMRNCRRITRQVGSAVMLVHHTRKGGDSERGSTALRGNSDTMIKASPADDLVLVECSKTKDDKPFNPYHVFLRPVSVPEVGDSLVVVPGEQLTRPIGHITSNQHKLLEIMAMEVHKEGIATRELAEFAGLSLGTTMRTLNNLLMSKHVDKPMGQYAITEQGRVLIGKPSNQNATSDPRDPRKPEYVDQKLADDPFDPPDPFDSVNQNQVDHRGSRGSRGSSLR